MIKRRISRSLSPKFIIALDNDSAGEKARNELTAGFDKRGIEYCVYNPCCGFKDPNEALMNNPEAFRRAVIYGTEHIDDLIAQRINDDEAARKAEYDGQFSAKFRRVSILRSFLQALKCLTICLTADCMKGFTE